MSMKKGYLIGEVSKITGVSKDTLRFYDKINLLKPKYVDPHNKYRYYTYDQFWSIDIIVCCRNLGIPIEKVALILKSQDNEKVLDFLKEQREEAIKRSDYLKRIAEDIDWYERQQERIKMVKKDSQITVRKFEERKVLYGSNMDYMQAYHLKLQQLVNSVTPGQHTIRRNYGFILDETQILQNRFIKKGEYLQFDKEIFDVTQVDSRYLTTLPSGDYACYIVNVIDQTADFTCLIKWIEKNRYQFEFVTADEIGLQLFEYLDRGYMCEIQVLLKK